MDALLFGRLMEQAVSAARIVIRLEEDAAAGDYEYAAGRLAGLVEAAEVVSGIGAAQILETARQGARRLIAAG